MNVDPGMGMDTLQNPSNLGAVLRMIVTRYMQGGQDGPDGIASHRGPVDPGFLLQSPGHDMSGDNPSPFHTDDPMGALAQIIAQISQAPHGPSPQAPRQGYAPGGVTYRPPARKPVAPRQGYAPGGVSYRGVGGGVAPPTMQQRMSMIAQRFQKNTR